MTDEPLDELPEEPLDEPLRAAARAYHTPSDTPREAMWRAIEARRRAERVRQPPARRWLTWAVAAAAVLAIGIGIGRVSVPGARPGPPAHRPGLVSTRPPRGSETAYRLVTVDHLGQSEAFLTRFRASVRTEPQEQVASITARQLLATNRLLLDSPAGRDRRMRVLLEDLELVLAEIAQLSSEPVTGDRELIREGMERGGVLPRLRTVVPSGTTSTRGDL